ncbi:MAG: hypothetical protein HWN67_01770 [Candidatus Helarchaeota archaeon]|nr:hypothetical protein [Candidatus Helarchaeota archaeon]
MDIKKINPAINQYCFAERLKSFTIILINNVLRYKDITQTNKEISSEEILKWFLNDLIRETELAINITKGTHFQSALTLINNAFSKFPQNSEGVIQNLRDALTKITTQASNAYSKL